MSEEIATHGEPAGTGQIGSRRFIAIDPARATMGHSHTPKRPSRLRRMWDRLRGRRQTYFAGTVSYDFESYSRHPMGYNTGPSEWAHPVVIVAPNAERKTLQSDAWAEMKAYCEADVELTRRMMIAITQPAARIQPDGSVVYDPWHWTGRHE